MPRRVLLAAAVLLAAGACGGGGDEGAAPATTAARAPTTTSTVKQIEGVQTFVVDAGHREGTIAYPQTPPVGGIHNAAWMPCGFYDQPVPSERAVHSLEHGAIWITYRPDLAQAEVDALAALARGRNLILVSRWDEGLPSPLVVTGWGRQLRLETSSDPRLGEFVRLYVNQGPEINAPC
ncbi:MAG TPA: DUF3105 domain-containing protein [Acidimicrobiales bacterium]|jgi:hypothetical protein|nr:DUF3105 domain-containing protein [Acidimicrobiales bacterium]